MSSPSILAAVYSHLQANTSLCSLLIGGSSSVLAQGRISGTTPVPCITVGHLGGRGDPYGEVARDELRVRAYYGAEQAEFYTIEAVLPKIMRALHLSTLGAVDSIGLLECRWSGFTSGDLYDFTTRYYYREVRFFIWKGEHLG